MKIWECVAKVNGTRLTVTITDSATTATAKQSYAVDIPTLVGGSTAFVDVHAVLIME